MASNLYASHDHAGPKNGRKTMFPGVPWQGCRFRHQPSIQCTVVCQVTGTRNGIFGLGLPLNIRKRCSMRQSPCHRRRPLCASRGAAHLFGVGVMAALVRVKNHRFRISAYRSPLQRVRHQIIRHADVKRQPTTLRLNRSGTAARYKKPAPCAGTSCRLLTSD